MPSVWVGDCTVRTWMRWWGPSGPALFAAVRARMDVLPDVAILHQVGGLSRCFFPYIYIYIYGGCVNMFEIYKFSSPNERHISYTFIPFLFFTPFLACFFDWACETLTLWLASWTFACRRLHGYTLQEPQIVNEVDFSSLFFSFFSGSAGMLALPRVCAAIGERPLLRRCLQEMTWAPEPGMTTHTHTLSLSLYIYIYSI